MLPKYEKLTPRDVLISMAKQYFRDSKYDLLNLKGQMSTRNFHRLKQVLELDYDSVKSQNSQRIEW